MLLSIQLLGYLDDLLNIDYIHFEQMVHRIYPAELQFNKLMLLIPKQLLDLNLSVHNDTVSTKIHDKRDDYDFDIVKFPFLDGDVPRSAFSFVYISHLFALPEQLRMLLGSIIVTI